VLFSSYETIPGPNVQLAIEQLKDYADTMVLRAGDVSIGPLTLGHTAQVPVGASNEATPQFQAHGTAFIGQGSYRWSANAAGPNISLFKSRGAAIGTRAAVQSGDALGSVTFYGDDGTNAPPGAQLRAMVDGTPGAGDMPGRLEFLTTSDGAAAPVVRWSVYSTGHMTPFVDNAYNLGSASLRAANVFSALGSFGNLTASGNDLIAAGGTANAAQWAVFRNANVGASATIGLLFGNDGSASQAGVFVNSSAKTDFGGASSINIGNYGAAGLGFFTNNTFRGGFNSAGMFTALGDFQQGHATQVPLGASNSFTPSSQFHSTVGISSFSRWSNDNGGPQMGFFKSRGTAIGTRGLVAADDTIFSLSGYIDDGTNAPPAAMIRANVDGTPGAGDAPGRLSFWTTPDGGVNLVERMRINNAGRIQMMVDLSVGFASYPAAAVKLHVGGVAAATTPTLGAATGIAALFSNTDAAYGLALGVGGAGNAWLQVQRVDAVATAYHLLLQPSGGFVGIALGASPTSPLQIASAAARVTPAGGYLVQSFGGGNSYWLLSANTNFNSAIHFGDPDSNTVGRIEYVHNGDRMEFHVAGSERLRIEAATITVNIPATLPNGASRTAAVRTGTSNEAISTKTAYDAAAYVALTDAATIAWDMSLGINFSVTLAGNRTLGAVTNTVAGKTGSILVYQDATGGRTLAFNAVYKFANGVAPTLDTVANRLTMLFYQVIDSSNIFISHAAGVR